MKRAILIFVFTFICVNFSFAEENIQIKNSLELCKVLNSVNIYTNPNLSNIQKYLQNFFPKMKTDGTNDFQNKFYISKYQYAFGLKTTGILNPETLKFLRMQNDCFDIERRISQMENSVPVILPNQSQIIQNLITNYVYGTTTVPN